MAERDELMHKTGPFLLEAFIRITVEECNRLRAKLNMPQITKENFFNQINNDLSHLEPYNWMNTPKK